MQPVIPATFLFLCIGALILIRRIQSMHKPTKGKGKRIILPLLFLTPGFVFFLNPGDVTYPQLFIAIFFRNWSLSSSYYMVRLRNTR